MMNAKTDLHRVQAMKARQRRRMKAAQKIAENLAEGSSKLRHAIERHARQRFTPQQRLNILAHVRASMYHPCDTGLPWLPEIGEVFMEHLTYKDGLNVELTPEEE